MRAPASLMPAPAAAGRALLAAALAVLAAGAGAPQASAGSTPAAADAVAPPAAAAVAPRAVLAFLPEGGDDNPAPVLERLDERRALALGLLSATQGRFSAQQMMLDISAGARTSRAVYSPEEPPRLELVVGGDGSGFVFGWRRAVERAGTALARIEPGMLADRIPGGAAYAGVAGRAHVEAVVAADRSGDVATASLGSAATLARRARALTARHRLVVVGLPTAARGDRALDALLRARRAGELLIVVQAPPRTSAPQLLPIGVVGLDGPGGSLTSATTNLEGVVAAIDLPVTILDALGLPVPRTARGQRLRVDTGRDADALAALEARLRVVGGRRIPMAAALLFTWAALTLALGVVADRRGVRAAMRIGGLAFMWVLPLLLATGWLAPPRLAEVAIVTGGSFGLGALTDRLVAWPRAPLVPAAVAVVGYAVDLAFGSPLIIRSLLGPNPRSGARFYGLGNELESTLTALLLIGLGALLWGRGRSRACAATVACVGAVFAVFVGAGGLGADVGGVIMVAAGIATATLLLAPGPPSRRAIALAAAAPAAALAALAAVDLASGADGHFTRAVLRADSAGSLGDLVARRYTLAFTVLTNGAMPLLTLVAVLAAAYGVRHRERVYAAVRGSPSWRAALVGGLVASVTGALFNDSGPLLLVLGVFVLACATAYLRGGDPAGAAGAGAAAPG